MYREKFTSTLTALFQLHLLSDSSADIFLTRKKTQRIGQEVIPLIIQAQVLIIMLDLQAMIHRTMHFNTGEIGGFLKNLITCTWCKVKKRIMQRNIYTMLLVRTLKMKTTNQSKKAFLDITGWTIVMEVMARITGLLIVNNRCKILLLVSIRSRKILLLRAISHSHIILMMTHNRIKIVLLKTISRRENAFLLMARHRFLVKAINRNKILLIVAISRSTDQILLVVPIDLFLLKRKMILSIQNLSWTSSEITQGFGSFRQCSMALTLHKTSFHQIIKTICRTWIQQKNNVLRAVKLQLLFCWSFSLANMLMSIFVANAAKYLLTWLLVKIKRQFLALNVNTLPYSEKMKKKLLQTRCF